MANVVFKRGSAVEIAAVPVTDGYILWDTTNNIMYMDNGQRRLIFGVGGADGIRPVEYGGTGGSTPADAAMALLVDSLDASPRHVTANTDLDNYTNAGVYSCATPSVAATVANNPWTTGTFTLIVRHIESSNTFVQWLVGCCENQDGGCGWFFRACVNGTWFQWQAINTGKNKFNVEGETLAHTDSNGVLTASNTLNADLTINGTLTAEKVIGASFADMHDVIVCDEMPVSVVSGKWYAVKNESGTASAGTVQLPVRVDDFNLSSTWTCDYIWTDDDGYANWQSTPSTVKKTVTFNFNIPTGATVTSAKVHSSWSGTLYGADIRRVAGQTIDSDGFVTVDIPSNGATSMDVEFTFKALPDSKNSHWNQGGSNTEGEFMVEHSSSAVIKDVYLLLEYTIDGTGGTSILTPYTLYRA